MESDSLCFLSVTNPEDEVEIAVEKSTTHIHTHTHTHTDQFVVFKVWLTVNIDVNLVL